MKMPKRPKQHQVEDLSVVAFRKILPREWVYRDKDKDYGIDGEVEIFDENDTATGIIFYVQLKATDSESETSQKRVKLRNEAINYYKALELPVLIVRYISESEEIYFRWAHTIDRYKQKENAKTYSFAMSEENLWDEDTAKSLYEFLLKLRVFKNKSNIFPIRLFLNFTFNEFCGYKTHSLKSKFRTELSSKSQYFSIVNSPKDCDFQVNVSDSEISIFVLEGVTGAYLHSINKIEYSNIDELIGDIFITTSLALWSFNKELNAYEVLNIFGQHSQSLKNHAVAIHFIQLCFSLGKINKAYELWNNMPSDEKDEVLNAKFQMLSLMALKALNTEDLKLHEEYLKQQISLNQDHETAYYNYANFLHNQRRLREAFSNYIKAFQFEAKYHNASHIHQEVAGTLFDLKRYKLAVMYYEKAMKISDDPKVEVLYADSLMMYGEFALARKSFRNYFDNSTDIDGEWILKDTVLEYLISEYSFKSQKRQPKLAEQQEVFKKLGKEIITIEDLRKVIKIDALNSLAWFNLGWLYKESQDWENAMASYLFCALINRGDVEAWMNAFVCAWNLGNTELSLLIIKVGYQTNGEEFIQSIYSIFEKIATNVPNELVSKLLDGLEHIVSETKKHNLFAPTLRIYDGHEFKNIYDLNEEIKEPKNE